MLRVEDPAPGTRRMDGISTGLCHSQKYSGRNSGPERLTPTQCVASETTGGASVRNLLGWQTLGASWESGWLHDWRDHGSPRPHTVSPRGHCLPQQDLAELPLGTTSISLS